MARPTHRPIHAPLAPGETPRKPTNAFPWPPKLARLLGQMPDIQLARRAGISSRAVLDERRRRRIPAFQHQSSDTLWTRAMIARLGTESDNNVGLELGLPKGVVSNKRRALGIPPFVESKRRTFRWPPAALNLLGKISDYRLGPKFGISSKLVGWKRNSLRIPPFVPASRPTRWTDTMTAALDSLSDIAAARRYGISVQAVVRKRLELGVRRGRFTRRWSNSETALLGKYTDRAVSRRLGIKIHVVRHWRRHLGIAGAVRVPWNSRWDGLLGKLTDVEIAKRLGCTPTAVRMRRKKLGVVSRTGGRRWTTSEDALLGRLPDSDVGRRIGRGTESIRARRKRLGIPARGTRSSRGRGGG